MPAQLPKLGYALCPDFLFPHACGPDAVALHSGGAPTRVIHAVGVPRAGTWQLTAAAITRERLLVLFQWLRRRVSSAPAHRRAAASRRNSSRSLYLLSKQSLHPLPSPRTCRRPVVAPVAEQLVPRPPGPGTGRRMGATGFACHCSYETKNEPPTPSPDNSHQLAISIERTAQLAAHQTCSHEYRLDFDRANTETTTSKI